MKENIKYGNLHNPWIFLSKKRDFATLHELRCYVMFITIFRNFCL